MCNIKDRKCRFEVFPPGVSGAKFIFPREQALLCDGSQGCTWSLFCPQTADGMKPLGTVSHPLVQWMSPQGTRAAPTYLSVPGIQLRDWQQQALSTRLPLLITPLPLLLSWYICLSWQEAYQGVSPAEMAGLAQRDSMALSTKRTTCYPVTGKKHKNRLS